MITSIKPTCKDCADRQVGCHGKCEKYNAYVAANNAEYAKMKKAFAEERKVTEYEIKRARKIKKRRNG